MRVANKKKLIKDDEICVYKYPIEKHLKESKIYELSNEKENVDFIISDRVCKKFIRFIKQRRLKA